MSQIHPFLLIYIFLSFYGGGRERGSRGRLFYLGNHYVLRLPLYSWQSSCLGFSNVGTKGMWQDVPLTVYFNVTHGCNCSLNGIYEVPLYPKCRWAPHCLRFIPLNWMSFICVALLVRWYSSSSVKSISMTDVEKNLFLIFSLTVKSFLEFSSYITIQIERLFHVYYN